MLRVRSSSVWLARGSAVRHRTKNRTAKAMMPTMSSLVFGRSGLVLSCARVTAATTFTSAPRLLDGEGEHEAEERERLDERQTDEHRRPHHRRRLGLAGDAFERLADQDTE